MTRFRSSLVLFALLFLLSLPAMAQVATFLGSVVDEAGQPIEGAQITVTSTKTSGTKTTDTNSKGKFKLSFQTHQLQFEYEMLVEKVGFRPVSYTFTPTATRKMSEEFVLEKGEVQVAENLGDLGSVMSGTGNAAIMAFNEGLTAQRDNDLATARSKFEAALAEDPELGPAQVALSQVLLDQKDYEASLAAADKALGLQIARADALQVKYQALRALGRQEEADAVSAELKTAEDAVVSARRIYNEGGTAFQANDHETALAKFIEAATLDPSLVDAHHAIATLLYTKGDYEGSAASAEKALDLGSDNLATLRVLYNAYDALGRSEELMEIAPRLAKVDPEFGGAKLLERAGDLWNSGATAQAVALAKQALAIDRTLAKAYYYIGLDHLSGGRGAEAKENLQKFVDMAPEDSEAATAKEMLTYIE